MTRRVVGILLLILATPAIAWASLLLLIVNHALDDPKMYDQSISGLATNSLKYYALGTIIGLAGLGLIYRDRLSAVFTADQKQ